MTERKIEASVPYSLPCEDGLALRKMRTGCRSALTPSVFEKMRLVEGERIRLRSSVPNVAEESIERYPALR